MVLISLLFVGINFQQVLSAVSLHIISESSSIVIVYEYEYDINYAVPQQ